MTGALSREKYIGQRGLPGTGKSQLWKMWGAEKQRIWTCPPGLGNWLAITWASNLALCAPDEGARGNREKKLTLIIL